LALVERWCNRAILLHQGHIMAMGATKEVVAAYQQLIESGAPQPPTEIVAAE